MFADYSAEIKIAIFKPFQNANVTYEDRPKIARLQKLHVLTGALKMQEWKMQEWKLQEKTAEVEIAGVENTGAKTYGKPIEQKIKICIN